VEPRQLLKGGSSKGSRRYRVRSEAQAQQAQQAQQLQNK
jgi:hypothetical protein